MTFDWSDRVHDPQGMYAVNCRVDFTPRPLFIHALSSDAETRDATIALHQFENWGLVFNSLAIFEDQEEIGRKVLARLHRCLREAVFEFDKQIVTGLWVI